MLPPVTPEEVRELCKKFGIAATAPAIGQDGHVYTPLYKPDGTLRLCECGQPAVHLFGGSGYECARCLEIRLQAEGYWKRQRSAHNLEQREKQRIRAAQHCAKYKHAFYAPEIAA